MRAKVNNNRTSGCQKREKQTLHNSALGVFICNVRKEKNMIIALVIITFFILCGLASISKLLETVIKNQIEIIRLLKNS